MQQRLPRDPSQASTSLTEVWFNNAPLLTPQAPAPGSADPSWSQPLMRPAFTSKPATRLKLPSTAAKNRSRTFEFMGNGSLTVTSSITGRSYRFAGYGAQLTIDPRDWGQLSRVTSLRIVEETHQFKK